MIIIIIVIFLYNNETIPIVINKFIPIERNKTIPVEINKFIPVEINKNKYGGDKDKHGCIGSAGYVWCNSSNTCIRPWEEKCP